MPVAGTDPTTELRTSWSLTWRVDEMVIERVFHGIGTLGQVWLRNPLAKGSVKIPAMGDALPKSSYIKDPNAGSNATVPELLGFPPEWLERLYVGDIRITTEEGEKSIKNVVVTYSTRAPADPQAPDVQISIVSETFILKWDGLGNILASGFESGVPVEAPGMVLSWTQSMVNFVDVVDEIINNVGKTNSTSWSIFGEALAGEDGEKGDTHQWVFLGADAFRSGEVNWRPTFRFRWLPPVSVQVWSVPAIPGPTREDEKASHDIAFRRGRFYYYYNERANGSINQDGGANNAPSHTGIPFRGLQQKEIRREFDFNDFFGVDRFENPDGGE